MLGNQLPTYPKQSGGVELKLPQQAWFITVCYHWHLHQSRGRLGAWVSYGNRPPKVTLGSVSMYPLVSLMGLVAVTVCLPLLPLPPLDDVPMTSTYVCVFWMLVFLPV